MTELVVTTPEALQELIGDVLRRFYASEVSDCPGNGKRRSEWMTTSEAADYLRLTENSVRQMVAARKIPYSKIGSRLRFNKRHLDEWLG